MTTDRSAEFAVPPPSARPYRLFASGDACRLAAGLLDEQLWCLGRDVVRPSGNLLAEAGLCRRRPGGGTASYAATLERGVAVVWGFGCFYGEPGAGGVYVHRFAFAPALTAAADVGAVGHPLGLPPLVRPAAAADWRRVRELLPALLRWFAGYEHWVAETQGTAYRERCLADRGKPAAVPARRMAAEWEALAKKCRRVRPVGGRPTAWGAALGGLRAAAALAVNGSTRPRFRPLGKPALA